MSVFILKLTSWVSVNLQVQMNLTIEINLCSVHDEIILVYVQCDVKQII